MNFQINEVVLVKVDNSFHKGVFIGCDNGYYIVETIIASSYPWAVPCLYLPSEVFPYSKVIDLLLNI